MTATGATSAATGCAWASRSPTVVLLALGIVLATLPRLLDDYLAQQEQTNLEARTAAVAALVGERSCGDHDHGPGLPAAGRSTRPPTRRCPSDTLIERAGQLDDRVRRRPDRRTSRSPTCTSRSSRARRRRPTGEPRLPPATPPCRRTRAAPGQQRESLIARRDRAGAATRTGRSSPGAVPSRPVERDPRATRSPRASRRSRPSTRCC